MHKGGGRIFARIGGVQAFLIGQDHQRIGFDQIGDQGAQGVVVTELDFVGDHRVVLVDDRQDLVLQQRHQGGAGIQIAFAVGQIGMGE